MTKCKEPANPGRRPDYIRLLTYIQEYRHHFGDHYISLPRLRKSRPNLSIFLNPENQMDIGNIKLRSLLFTAAQYIKQSARMHESFRAQLKQKDGIAQIKLMDNR
jgi:hypothetical protein